MKVLCVADYVYCPTGTPTRLTIGQEYTVIDSFKYFGHLIYVLSEYPDEGFCSKGLIPISDIDETELIKERELVIVNH